MPKFKTHVKVEVEVYYEHQQYEAPNRYHPEIPEIADDIHVKILTNIFDLANSDEIFEACSDHIDNIKEETARDHAECICDSLTDR